MRSEFEKHYLSLDFYTKGSAQLCLDACTFDEKQDAYLPNMDWILENDADECVIYCCMLNTAYISFKHLQSKIDKLQANFDQHDQWLGQRNRDVQELNDIIAKHVAEKDKLQKRVDKAIAILSSKKKMYVDMVIEVEKALKGGNK